VAYISNRHRLLAVLARNELLNLILSDVFNMIRVHYTCIEREVNLGEHIFRKNVSGCSQNLDTPLDAADVLITHNSKHPVAMFTPWVCSLVILHIGTERKRASVVRALLNDSMTIQNWNVMSVVMLKANTTKTDAVRVTSR
jgi:hypothetical protein